MFRQIVEEHPTGICLSAARPEIFQAEIDNAMAQGIPVICVVADVPDSKRVLYIGADNVKAGRESLKQMAALVRVTGTLRSLRFPDSVTSTIESRAWWTRRRISPLSG